MVSLIISSNAHYLISPVVSCLGLRTNLPTRTPVAFGVTKKDRFWGFTELNTTTRRSAVFCSGSSHFEADLDLEKELLEFMKSSKNPCDFPTKHELLDAGRIDLVDAIIKKGGWLSLGWDVSDDENEQNRKEFELHARLNPSPSSCAPNHQIDSPSGRSLEAVVQEDAGIEGILLRLEKHRSLSFGASMQENGHYSTYASREDNGVSLGSSLSSPRETTAQTYYFEKSNREENNLKDRVLTTQGEAEIQERHKEINSDYIKSRLHQMQLELSSSLCLLRSKNETPNPEGHISSSRELRHLSDVWEFQESEIIKAKDRLRSIRAKLAVLEGKMSLSISDTKKIVEKKQRRIDSGYRTLQLLRTICIIWPNSASKVLLAGSFDGWTTQRKMERSSDGVFSLCLKLYPGRYEMKFIVDGVWKVDPLRPIVNNGVYENNVLFVQE